VRLGLHADASSGIAIADPDGVRYEYRRFIKETYPEVAALRVSVRHHGDLGRSSSDLRTYTKSSLPRALVCLNPRCTAGGYDLMPILDEAIRAKAATREAALECLGNDGVPRGRGHGCRCANSVQVAIEISYAPDDDAVPAVEGAFHGDGEMPVRAIGNG
jgi:hypothetical protein